MSVTFFPAGNQEYCDQNGLVGKTVYNCQCVDFPEHYPSENPCRECGGTGKVSFDDYPFEANLANGNAQAVQEMLGMPLGYCGECGPQVILDGVAFVRSLNATGHEPLVKTSTITGDRVRIVNCGRTPEQVKSYLDRFEAIAREALRRGVNVVWG